MIAKLSDELALELERNGDLPLTVANPRTNRLYVLLAMDKYASATQSTGDSPLPESDWNEEKNARRYALIKKEIAGELSAEELGELAQLQRAVDRYLHNVAPLPWDAMQQLHERLVGASQAESS